MRRASPRIRTCLFLLASVAIAPGARAEDAARAERFDVRTMGTVGAVTVVTPDSASVAAIAERALASFRAVDARLSNWDPHSELSAAIGDHEASAREFASVKAPSSAKVYHVLRSDEYLHAGELARAALDAEPRSAASHNNFGIARPAPSTTPTAWVNCSRARPRR